MNPRTNTVPPAPYQSGSANGGTPPAGTNGVEVAISDEPGDRTSPEPIGRLIRDRYFDAVRGRLAEYRHWLTPIDKGG